MALKYERIAEWLRSQVDAGTYGPGDVVPSERDLCEQWSVSRATAIKALDVLKSDGVVIAEQGKGHTVTKQPVARPAGDRRAGTARSSGRPFTRLGTPTYEVPPPHIAEALELDEAPPVEDVEPGAALRRDRLVLLEDGSPLTLVSAWFAPHISEACPRLRQDGPIAEGTTRYVARRTGRAPTWGQDATTVRLASEGEAQLLGAQAPAPVAVDLHSARDGQGVLVVEEGVTPGELWRRDDAYPMGGDS